MHNGFDTPRPAQVRRFGRVLYGEGLRMQAALAEPVRRGDLPDQVLLLEHNPVYTLGRNATRADIHVSDEFLEKNGVEVHRTDRGGQVTYHGPGQIVAYPICNLRGGRQDVSRLVRGLEQAMIGAAGDFGVRAGRLAGHPGVWVETARGWEKLGAVGLHLKKWVSTHGLAFNLSPAMEHFRWITPCGIADKGVCSLRTLLGDACPTWADARAGLERRLLEALALEPLPAPEPSRSVSVTVWRRGASGPEMLVTRDPERGGAWRVGLAGPVGPGETPGDAAARMAGEAGVAGVAAGPGLSHTFLADPPPGRAAGGQSPDGRPLFNTETCFRMEAPPGAETGAGATGHAARRWLPPEDAASLAAEGGGIAAPGPGGDRDGGRSRMP